jgi:hypothetical protein
MIHALAVECSFPRASVQLEARVWQEIPKNAPRLLSSDGFGGTGDGPSLPPIPPKIILGIKKNLQAIGPAPKKYLGPSTNSS